MDDHKNVMETARQFYVVKGIPEPKDLRNTVHKYLELARKNPNANLYQMLMDRMTTFK